MSEIIAQKPSGFLQAMAPASIEAAKEFCQVLAKTDFVPKAFRGKPDSIMVVGMMGARLGVDIFTAMNGIADINGKPAIYGDLMLAICLNHPSFSDCVETTEGVPFQDTFRAVCSAVRKGREPVVRSYSVQEAKEAGLWKKAGPWTTAPARMLQNRARAFALRDAFADALAGFHSREELSDAIDITADTTVSRDAPTIAEVKPAIVQQVEATPEETKKTQEKQEKPKPTRNGAQIAMRALCDKLDKTDPDWSMTVAERITNLRQTPGAAFVPLKSMDEKQIQCVQRDCSAIAVLETKESIEEMLNDWERIKKEGEA
jgi:hypothetical protein